MDARIEILKRHSENGLQCEVKYNMSEKYIIEAMQEYADLCQSANMERIRELESKAGALLNSISPAEKDKHFTECYELIKILNPDKK